MRGIEKFRPNEMLVQTPSVQYRPKVKVRITHLIFGAFGAIFGNLGVFAAIAITPFVIEIFACAVFIVEIDCTLDEATNIRFNDSLWWLPFLFSAIITSIFAVAWHRFILIGRRETASPVQLRFGWREAKFFLYYFSFQVVVAFYIFLMQTIPLGLLGNISVVALWGLLWARFSFIFPAISVNADRGLIAAWRQSKGVSWRLFFASFLVMFLWDAINRVMGFAGTSATQPATKAGAYTELAVDLLLEFLLVAVLAGVVSLAYKHQTGWTPDTPGESQAVAE